MIDFVFPNNNEQEFVNIAERLKLEGLCFIYDKPMSVPVIKTNLKLSTAVLCTPKNIQKYRGHTTIMHAGNNPRVILEQFKPNYIFGLESQSRHDFIHHRASGLNQVLARLAKDNNVTVLFSFSEILKSRPKDRAVLMGRISQNIRFAKKFGFSSRFFSLADNPFHLRSKHMLNSFFACLSSNQ